MHPPKAVRYLDADLTAARASTADRVSMAETQQGKRAGFSKVMAALLNKKLIVIEGDMVKRSRVIETIDDVFQ